jgi:DNA-binding MarR family transcriptional regulator
MAEITEKWGNTVTRYSLLAYVAQHPGSTTPEVAKGLGAHQAVAYSQLTELYTKSLLIRVKGVMHGEAHRWYPLAGIQ